MPANSIFSTGNAQMANSVQKSISPKMDSQQDFQADVSHKLCSKFFIAGLNFA